MKRGSTRKFIRGTALSLLLCTGSWLLPGAASCALTGDCDGDNTVGIAEVQSAVNMYLGIKPASSCVDVDGSGTVAIAEVQQTVNAFLGLVAPVYAKRVTGQVKDPVNGDLPLQGGTVTAYRTGSGTAVATATVQSDGSYSLNTLSGGNSYTLLFSRTGYGNVNYYGVTPTLSAETVLEPVLLLPDTTVGQTAQVNGFVTDAANNKGVPYLQLRFRAGLGATTGDLVPQTTSTKDGTSGTMPGNWYRNYFPAGSYTAEVVSPDGGTTLGYFTVHSVPGVPACNNSQGAAVATGSGQADSYRAVLSWGSTPADLDLHLTGPLAPGDTMTTIGDNDTARFHIDSTHTVYPYESGVVGSYPTLTTAGTDAYLDMDQADHGKDNGNETVTILAQRSGLYRFYVYNNSATGTLAGSGGQLKLYKGTTLVRSFPVPALSGNTWHVFDLDGSTVTAVNTVTTVTPDQTYNLARMVPGSAAEEMSQFKPLVKTIRTH
ncbi:MAG TPA: hypothetical protein DCZ75_15585 [Geobacter sp.]|nr:hypothetical protein [Geobacter sp.]